MVYGLWCYNSVLQIKMRSATEKLMSVPKIPGLCSNPLIPLIYLITEAVIYIWIESAVTPQSKIFGWTVKYPNNRPGLILKYV